MPEIQFPTIPGLLGIPGLVAGGGGFWRLGLLFWRLGLGVWLGVVVCSVGVRAGFIRGAGGGVGAGGGGGIGVEVGLGGLTSLARSPTYEPWNVCFPRRQLLWPLGLWEMTSPN